MKLNLSIRQLILLILSALILGFAYVSSSNNSLISNQSRITVFSFIDMLPKCKVKGLSNTVHIIKQFEKYYKIKNTNYYPYYKTKNQKINWQIGVYVSKIKKQVETMAALLNPEGISIKSSLIKLKSSSVFEFFTGIVSKNREDANVKFIIKIYQKNNKVVMIKEISKRTLPYKWTSHKLPLGSLAGKNVKIELKTVIEKGKNKSLIYPFWGKPIITENRSFDKPNVILIMIDAVRSDILGCYGSKLGITPNIDNYAKKSVVFKNCIANANWTRPSELSMFTSVYPRKLKINMLDFPVSQKELNYFYHKAKFKTMPSYFKENGYLTRGVINNIFLQAFTKTGVDIGFDHMTDFRTLNRDTIDITDTAYAWIKKNYKKPYFLFLNYNSPHKPYSAPKRFFKQIKDDPDWRFERRVKEYLAEIAFADFHIGRLLNSLKKGGLLNNTIVVFCADHGEVLWPFHNYSTVYSDYTRFGHSLTMLDEELKVPLIMYYPKKLKPSIISKQVQLVDLFPTIVEASGLKLKKVFKTQFDGVSLMPHINGLSNFASRPAYTQGFMLEGLRTERYKYVYRPPGFDKVGPMGGPVTHSVPEELYDLKNDPKERTNILFRNKKVLIKMRKLFSKYKDQRLKNTIYFVSGKKKTSYNGYIKTDGVFYKRIKNNKNLRMSKNGKKIFFNYIGDNYEINKIQFQVHPNFAPIDFVIYKNKRLLTPKDLFLGYGGIAFLKNRLRIYRKNHFEQAQCNTEPYPMDMKKTGVYFIREKSEFKINYSKDNSKLSTEIKTVLRDWGYVQR